LRLENGRLSDRYRIGTDTGCIVLNSIGYFCMGDPILRASLQVRQLLTGRITQDDQSVHDMGRGWRGRRRRESETLYQPPRDTKTAQYWVLAIGDRWCRNPATSRKWWQQSQLSIT